RQYDSSLLELQTLRAELALRPVSVVIDGECMAGDVHTGTQRVVLEVARGLARARPTARVAVAVPSESRAVVAEALRGTGVNVVARRSTEKFDVVYRPYQMLRADELTWCREAGHRLVVSQLDMIGFSNPYYHPSTSLFLLARNLQRAMMAEADAVTFISEFGRDAARAECAELDESRLHVVWCGADTIPATGTRPSNLPEQVEQFVACLSATFWHKNRLHAIRTFAELCANHAFAGHLVIAGPEPFYGRSTDAESVLVDSLADDVQARIHYLGQVAEASKWWLLQHASAVLYPSVVEGFGLVPFEAASVGTPTLAFQGTALGEILGAGPALIDTWDAQAWASRVGDWLADPTAVEDALGHVGDAAQRFTWDRTAAATWSAIDQTLQRVPVRQRAEEGGPLVHVGSITRGQALLTTQTHTARIGPAVARRARALFSRLRSMSP
ncbi:MAG TPA: glycosyltransferase, partial [Ilumatobacteraceae bacterium]|nr:glycosyltransferase [Ilumatobacteraceae bacterium]